MVMQYDITCCSEEVGLIWIYLESDWHSTDEHRRTVRQAFSTKYLTFKVARDTGLDYRRSFTLS
jgi:hypothetical protein